MARPGPSEAAARSTIPSIHVEAADDILARITDYFGKFFKIETTYKRKAKDLRKTWRNFTTLHKLVQKESGSVFVFPKKPPALSQAKRPEVRDSLRKALNEYLQTLMQLQPLPTAVRSFLEFDVEDQASASADSIKGGHHYPVVEFDKHYFTSATERRIQKRLYEPLIQLHDETDFIQERLHSGTDSVVHGVSLALGYKVT